MEQRELKELLSAVAVGELSPADAELRLRTAPFSDLGFAKVDHHRGIRQGVSEVVYGAGKTPEQIASVIFTMLKAGQQRVLVTRLAVEDARKLEQLLYAGDTSGVSDKAAHVSEAMPAGEVAAEGGRLCAAAGAEKRAGEEMHSSASAADEGSASEEMHSSASAAGEGTAVELPLFTYYDLPQVALVGEMPEPSSAGQVVVACGGTSDIYVAEEAALTAEYMGCKVKRIYDVGVAGLHRLLSHVDELASARVVVAVAGMEGALPSVIGGLVACPVIAVPTSVGYGASFDGLAALLAMLNSCASGVSVVNIDNGFGAGYQASLIAQ